jgi:hypothetical protein
MSTLLLDEIGNHCILIVEGLAATSSELTIPHVIRDEEDFLLQPLAPGGVGNGGVSVAVIDFVDDGKDWDFEEDGEKPASLDTDLKVVGIVEPCSDVATIELHEAQKVDVIRLEKSDVGKILKFISGKAKRTEIIELIINFSHNLRSPFCAITTPESILNFSSRKLMKDTLLH